MKNQADKRFFCSKQAFILILLFLFGGAGVVLCTVFPVNTKDSVLNNLLNEILPRFCICVPIFGIMLWDNRALLKFSRLTLKQWIWLLPPLAVTIVNFPFSALINKTATIDRGDLWWLFVLNCLLVGLTEEWLFRGILLDFFLMRSEEKGKSCFVPVLLSSALFGLYHLLNLFGGAGIGATFLQVGYSFLIGAMLAVVFCKVRNLWICIFLHALFDAGGLLVSRLGNGNPQDLAFWILTSVVGVLCTAHIVITLIRLCKNPKK